MLRSIVKFFAQRALRDVHRRLDELEWRVLDALGRLHNMQHRSKRHG